jgi:hypothetical protein
LIVVAPAVSYGPMTPWLLLLALAPGQNPAAAAVPTKVDIVSVTGCLKETTPNTWTLTNATAPVPSSANAPPAKEIPATPPVGTGVFRLIGVSEFNLPSYRDHTVVIKGLFIKATPMSRVNMTSVTTVSASCAPAPK